MHRPALLFCTLSLVGGVAAGCRSSDPCSVYDGACIALTVSGTGVASVDDLSIRVVDEAGLSRAGQQTVAAPVALPLQTLVELPSGVSGNLKLTVDGFLNGAWVGGDSTTVTLAPGGRTHAQVDLSPRGTDGGSPPDGNGVPDAAASGDMTLISGCPKNPIFCDDFESGDFSAWPGPPTETGTGETFKVTSAFAWRGSHSAHAQIPSMANTGGISVTKSFTGVASGIFAARFYVYAAAVPATWTGLISFDNGVSVDIGLNAGDGFWKVYFNTDFASNVRFTFGIWQCVELVLDYQNALQKSLALYVSAASTPNNGAPPIVSAVSLPIGTVSMVQLGPWRTPSMFAQDLFFDDLAIADHRIGCE